MHFPAANDPKRFASCGVEISASCPPPESNASGSKQHGPFGQKGSLAALVTDGQVAAGLALVHADLGRDALPELGDVADDADHPAAVAQAGPQGNKLFPPCLVPPAEALPP